MARKRKDTYCVTGEWAKHLKPYGKRVMAKAERREANRTIDKDVKDIPIQHGDDPRCICRPCPPDRDDMFWREDEEVQCETKARGKGLIS